MGRRYISMGRQRIEIRRIESEDARQVCFSKHHTGMFKKASKLATLCSVEAGLALTHGDLGPRQGPMPRRGP